MEPKPRQLHTSPVRTRLRSPRLSPNYMPPRERNGLVPLDLEDPETAIRIVWLMAAASFLVAVVSGIGELLGWWDLVGEIGLTVGSTVALLLTATGLLANASRGQVSDVHQNVVAVHGAVRDNGSKLDKLETLDDVQYELDRQTGVLQQIRDRM